MEREIVQHPARALHATVLRGIELEHDCPDCPDGLPDVVATCTQCASTMAYRGVGLLRNGAHVHYFECVHSPREVHALSFVIAG